MEGVNHVYVVEVGRGSLVGDVDRMLQRQAPDREGFELGVAGLDAALVLVVELAEAYCHLAASGAGGRDDYKGSRGLDVVVAAEPLVGVDEVHVGGVALDGIVAVGGHSHALQALAEGVGAALAVVVCDYHRVDRESAADEGLAQTEHIHIVGYAQILAYFVFLDVACGNHDDYLGLVGQLPEHAQLAVRLEARKHAAGVVVVEKLAAQFQIELVAELGDALAYVFRLDAEVFVVVESCFHSYFCPDDYGSSVIDLGSLCYAKNGSDMASHRFCKDKKFLSNPGYCRAPLE